ncbi:MAG TPA: YwqG family protein [Nocardioidaceae bacterium]|nr:YwqG family protein [Nocardioidaceae bacterium]
MAPDRYDELMARRAELERELHERMRRHHDDMMRQLPLLGSSAKAFGRRTDGIRIAGDGSLDAHLELQDVHGRTSTVVLRADPNGPVEELGGATPAVTDTPPPHAADETASRLDAVARLAREHLPATAVEGFLGLLLPALRLEHAGDGDPVVAQLGGLPRLPINTWPVWEGHGPLSHVLSFDCEVVGTLLPELGLPGTGVLAFFYFDGSFDDFASTVGTWDPATSPGFRVLHVQPDQAAPHDRMDVATPAPPGLTVFPSVALTAVRTLTWPASESPLTDSFRATSGATEEAVAALYRALHELPQGGYDTHQVGGYATPQQGAVELEVEQLRRGLAGEPFEWQDSEVLAAARQWRLLLQVASDDDAAMMWGDVGQLYYLTLNASDPESALFTWQCG